MFGEEGIGPPLMVSTSAVSLEMRSLSQDGSQSATDPGIELPEGPAVGMLKVLKPTSGHLID